MSIMDIPYMKLLAFTLNIIGSWTYKPMGGKKWFANNRNSIIMFILLTACFVLGISYLNKNFKNLTFIQLGRIYMNIIMCFVCMQRVSMAWTKLYKTITHNFVNKIHLFHYKDKNDFALKIFQDVEKLSSIMSKFLHIELYSGNFLFNMTPLFFNYRSGMFNSLKPVNGTYELAGYYDLPFDYTNNFNNYLIISIFNWFLTFILGICFCIVDLYIFIIVFHLWGHIKILKHNLRSCPRPTNVNGDSSSLYMPAWYNEEESRNVRQLLLESMNHYRIIKDSMIEVSMGYGSMLCVYLLYHQVMGCVFLVEISEMSIEAIGMYGLLAVNSFHELIIMSIVFELLGSQSETIKDAVYDVPWECMGIENRKIVLMFLCDVQTPMDLKALGLLPVGVKTMASILKSSISYFMLLRTLAAKQQ